MAGILRSEVCRTCPERVKLTLKLLHMRSRYEKQSFNAKVRKRDKEVYISSLVNALRNCDTLTLWSPDEASFLTGTSASYESDVHALRRDYECYACPSMALDVSYKGYKKKRKKKEEKRHGQRCFVFCLVSCMVVGGRKRGNSFTLMQTLKLGP